uniref:Proline dehydrogenase n=1 Tax=Parascaris univalens TaxID=6257 RepID=A0A914ZDY4_PARUN
MIAAERSRQALHSIFHRILSLQKSSVASSTHTVIWKPSTEAAKEIEDCYGRLDLNFENSKEAFKSKTNYELFRALFVLHLCSYETLVKNNKAILKALRIPLGQNLFNRLLRATFFGQFVAGESREECREGYFTRRCAKESARTYDRWWTN